MFSPRTLDPRRRLAKVMGRIEQAIQFVCTQVCGDLRLIAQYRSQVTLLGHCTLATLLQQMVRRFAPYPLGQHDAHRFGQHQPVGQVKIARHALAVHFQSLGNVQGLYQRTGHHAANFRQGFSLGMPQAQAAFVLLGHGAVQDTEQPRHPCRGTDQHR